MSTRLQNPERAYAPQSALDADAVRAAYRRWAGGRRRRR